jgi:hypothetical protein
MKRNPIHFLLKEGVEKRIGRVVLIEKEFGSYTFLMKDELIRNIRLLF